MANLTVTELERAVDLLATELGLERLKDRLARRGAFSSRRGLGSTKALADRLYTLSGGLRRDVAATYAFHSVWGETFTSRIEQEQEKEKELETLAERINECLIDGKAIDTEKVTPLDEALAAYHRAMAAVLGSEVTWLDMLMKAVPAVADRVRTWSGGKPPGPVDPPEPPPSGAA
jgi:hypothetical protein